MVSASSFPLSCALSAGLSGIKVLQPRAPVCPAGTEEGVVDGNHSSNLCLSQRNHLPVI